MALEDIVNITITRQTQTVSQAGFGVVLIVDEHTTFVDRYRIYNDLDGMITDGFLVTDPAYLAAAAVFAQQPSPTTVAIGRKDVAPETWVEAVQAIRAVYDDWYGLIVSTRTQSDVEALALYIETTEKLFGTASSNADILNGALSTDIASVLQAAGYARTYVMYSGDTDQYADAAWMGDRFPSDPGSSTWAYKQLNTITFDELTPTQRSAALAKNSNVYTRVNGINITEQGKTAVGEFIDVIRGLDWLHARLSEDIFQHIVSQPKIPFTDGGITGIEAIMLNRFAIAVDQDVLADDPAPAVNVPRALAVPIVDRGNRHLPGITGNGRLAGAVHTLDVQITVTV